MPKNEVRITDPKRISDNGVLNVAAALLLAVSREYLTAKANHELDPNDEDFTAAYNDCREFLLTTPWNVTGMDNEEFISAIEARGIRAANRAELLERMAV